MKHEWLRNFSEGRRKVEGVRLRSGRCRERFLRVELEFIVEATVLRGSQSQGVIHFYSLFRNFP
jgi:hypothetical protein